jgi:hypothetical protein
VNLIAFHECVIHTVFVSGGLIRNQFYNFMNNNLETIKWQVSFVGVCFGWCGRLMVCRSRTRANRWLRENDLDESISCVCVDE